MVHKHNIHFQIRNNDYDNKNLYSLWSATALLKVSNEQINNGKSLDCPK